jgi:hypothetical protein
LLLDFQNFESSKLFVEKFGICGAMVDAEPSRHLVNEMRTVQDVANWAAFGSLSDYDSQGASFLRTLGATVDDGIADVAGIADDDLAAAIASWQSGVSDTGESVHATAVQKSKARRFIRACRIAAGTEWTTSENAAYEQSIRASQVGPSSAPLTVPAAHPRGGRRVKMSEVADVTCSEEIDAMSSDKVDIAMATYVKYMHADCPPEAEPTGDQLSALADLMAVSGTCYVDLAIWGPHQVRAQKAMKLTGLSFNSSGELVPQELRGPPDFGHWSACFRVFLSAMVMLDACLPPYLVAYVEFIAKFAKRYGQTCWAVIYQCEVRFRREHMERLRRKESKRLNDALRVGGTTEFDPSRPWQRIFQMALDESAFWHENLQEPCILILTKSRQSGSFLDGDCPVAVSAGGHLATFGTPGFAFVADSSGGDGGHRVAQRSEQAPPTRSIADKPRDAPKPKRPKMEPVLENGRLKTNRSGNTLCVAFQTGGCSQAGGASGIECPHNKEHRHLCNKCLGLHPGEGANPCTRQAAKPTKGRGKGSGKGKGKW